MRYNSADCEALEKAAKAGDKKAVKKLLLNYAVTCLSSQSEAQIDNLDLIKDLANREAEIYLEEKTGNITLRGTSFTIWSDARHKAYKEANKDWESSFNILNDGYQRALGESECLGTLTDNLYIWDYLISAQRVGLDGPILDIFQAKIGEGSEKTLIQYILSKVIEPPMVKLAMES